MSFDLPSADPEPERYQGRPLLAVLESYVLDCIGELGDAQQIAVAKIVERVFGGDGDWRTTIRTQLHLENSLDDNIRAMWRSNQETATEAGVVLLPVQFAKMIADHNFASLIEEV